VTRLNELEYVDGKVLANVWQTDSVLRIDPATGQVDALYDFSGLLSQAPPFSRDRRCAQRNRLRRTKGASVCDRQVVARIV
jgi:glutamine cyclotransferase